MGSESTHWRTGTCADDVIHQVGGGSVGGDQAPVAIPRRRTPNLTRRSR